MATFQESKIATNSSDANFRAWGKSISDGLTSVGVIKTADTGQINWASVTAPASASNTSAGYEIRQLNDALQATSPYFFKIEYGNGSTGNNPQIWVTVGHITDGAGTLTLGSGQGSVVRHLVYPVAGATASASSFNINISGSSSRFGVAMWNGGGSAQVGWFGFERSKDNAGADTGAYGTFLVSSQAGVPQIQYTLPINGGGLTAPGVETAFIWRMTSLTSSSFDNKKALAEIKPFIGKFGNPMTIGCGLKLVDWLTDAETFTATLYGSTRTFMVLKNVVAVTTGTTPNCYAMRWD
jgi:hypothetical protein